MKRVEFVKDGLPIELNPHLNRKVQIDGGSSISSSIRNNSIDISSKLIRRSLKRRKWSYLFGLIQLVFGIYIALLFGMTLFMNLVAGNYEDELNVGWDTVYGLQAAAFHYKLTAIYANMMYINLVNEFNGVKRAIPQSLKSVGFDEVQYLEESAKTSYNTCYKSLQTIKENLFSKKVRLSEDSIELVTRNPITFDPSSRFRNTPFVVPTQKSFSNFRESGMLAYRDVLYNYLPHKLNSMRAIGLESYETMVSSTSGQTQIDESTLLALRNSLIIQNYEVVEVTVSDMRTKYLSLMEHQVVHKNKFYQRIFLIYFICSVMISMMNFLCTNTTIWLTERKFKRIVRMYTRLKSIEIDIQTLLTEEHMTVCKKFRFHEQYMINSYLNMNLKWHDIKIKLGEAMDSAIEVVSQRNMKNKKERELRIGTLQERLGRPGSSLGRAHWTKNQDYIKSIRMGYLMNFLAIIAFITLSVMVFYIKTSYNNASHLLQIYMRSTVIQDNMTTDYLGFVLFRGFGQTFELDREKHQSLRFFNASSRELISNWEKERPSVEELLMDSSKIDEYLKMYTGNAVCGMMRSGDLMFEERSRLCEGAFQNKFSINTILQKFEDSISSTFEESSQDPVDFSRAEVHVAETSEEVFTADVTHGLVFQLISDRLSGYFYEEIEVIHTRMNKVIFLLRTYVLVGLFVAVSLCSVVSYTLIVRSYIHCCETFRIIYPDIILNNPYLFNSFKMYFQLSIS